MKTKTPAVSAVGTECRRTGGPDPKRSVFAEGTLSAELIDQAVKKAVSRGLFAVDDLKSAKVSRRVLRRVRQFVPAVEA